MFARRAENSRLKKIDKEVEGYSLNSGGKAGRDRGLKASNICPSELKRIQALGKGVPEVKGAVHGLVCAAGIS